LIFCMRHPVWGELGRVLGGRSGGRWRLVWRWVKRRTVLRWTEGRSIFGREMGLFWSVGRILDERELRGG